MSEEEQIPPGQEIGPPLPPGSAPPQARGEPRWTTIAILAAVALFLYLVRSILTPFVIAGVLAYVFGPVVAWVESRGRIPRAVALAVFLLSLFVPLGLLLWIVEPALARETNELAKDLPAIVTNLLVQLFGSERVEILGQVVDARAIDAYLRRGLLVAVGEPSGAIHAAAVVVETVLKTFLTLVLLVYFLLNPRPFGEMFLRLFPAQTRPEVRAVGAEIHAAMGRYVRGLAFLVALMATATWLGLSLLFHLPYSLPIAVATGFLEIIPFLGPVAAGTVASAVALATGGPQTALWVALFYFILRQLEDQLVMPVVIGHAVELHPAVNIFAVLAGTALWGIVGALLAIPVAAAIKVAFLHFRPE